MQAVLSLSDGPDFHNRSRRVRPMAIRSAGRRIMVPEARPRYAGYVAWRPAPLTVPSSAVRTGGRAAGCIHLPNLLGRPRADPIRYRARTAAVPVQLALVSERFRPDSSSRTCSPTANGFHGRAEPCRPDRSQDWHNRAAAFGGGHRAFRRRSPRWYGEPPEPFNPGDRRPRGAADGLRAELP